MPTRHILPTALLSAGLAIAGAPALVAPQSPRPEREVALPGGADITLRGSPNKDQLGNDMDLGDVNADGHIDLVIGAQWSSGAGRNIVGRSYVVFGRAEWPAELDMATGGADWSFFGAGREARLGSAVAVADWDGDGIEDPVLGSLLADQLDQHNGGAVYLVRGGPTAGGTVDFLYQDPSALLVGDSRRTDSDQLGTGIAVGDFNADGRQDLAVAAAFRLQETGAVFVWFGPIAPGTVHNLRDRPADWTVLGPAPNSWFGSNLAVGDVTGDGIDDLLASALGVAPAAVAELARDPANGGAVYVMAGGAGVGGQLDLANASATTTIVGRPEAKLGVALAVGTCGCRGQPIAVADVTDDGTDDLLIGAPMEDRFRGSVSVLQGPIGPGVIDLGEWGHGRIVGTAEGDRFGWSVVPGSLDRDDRVDVVVSSPWSPVGDQTNAGRVDGFRGPLRAEGVWDLEARPAALTVLGPEPGAGGGGGTVALDDIDIDGDPDLLWGLPDAAPLGRRSAGAVYVLRGPLLETRATHTPTATESPSATPTDTPTATGTPLPSASPTLDVAPSETPGATPSGPPSAAPSAASTATPTAPGPTPSATAGPGTHGGALWLPVAVCHR